MKEKSDKGSKGGGKGGEPFFTTEPVQNVVSGVDDTTPGGGKKSSGDKGGGKSKPMSKDKKY